MNMKRTVDVFDYSWDAISSLLESVISITPEWIIWTSLSIPAFQLFVYQRKKLFTLNY
jgi:hypothetical protein